jgi:hypothetical protein
MNREWQLRQQSSGNLLRLENTSSLTINAGDLATVSNGPVFKLTGGGSLAVFGVGTNAINITNNAACPGCIPVNLAAFGTANPAALLRNGAGPGQFVVDPTFLPFNGIGGGNTVTVSGTSGAVFMIDGPKSRVKLGP